MVTMSTILLNLHYIINNISPIARKKEYVERIRSYGHANLGGDYFNNIKKCWEPLVAPFSAVYLYEKV